MASKKMGASAKEIQRSEELMEKLSKEPENEGLITLAQGLSFGGVSLILSENVTPEEEELSLQCLLTGSVYESCLQAVFEEDSSLSFNEISSSPSKKEEFLADFQRRVAAAVEVSPDCVKVLSIERGSVKVNFVVLDSNGKEKQLPAASLHKIGKSFSQKLTLQPHKVFSFLKISPNFFDSRGNFDYSTSPKPHGGVRGGFPYYPPNGWKRYGLRVSQKYVRSLSFPPSSHPSLTNLK